MIKKEESEIFPLSKEKSIKGSRRLLREKIIQILTAFEVSETPWTTNFNHIFFRDFNFGDNEEKSEKLLTQDEVTEIESDTPIIWDPDEVEYAKMIIENAIVLGQSIEEKLKDIVSNWEIDRIAIIDKVIIQLAVAEFVMSPEVPVKVTLNEAIELAKKYSTSKSSVFINGILDKFIVTLNEENAIHKTGKGLQ